MERFHSAAFAFTFASFESSVLGCASWTVAGVSFVKRSARVRTAQMKLALDKAKRTAERTLTKSRDL